MKGTVMDEKRKVDADLEILGARVQGLATTVADIEGDVAKLAGLVKELAKHSADVAEAIVTITTPPEPQMKTWVVTIPPMDEYGVGEVDVLLMQYGDNPPTVAFRRERNQTWGRPFSTRVAP